MSTSTEVLERVGDADLLLPRRIQAALAANDRLKYYLSLLQTAVASASQPAHEAPSLRATRAVSGVTDDTLDGVVSHSRVAPDGRVLVPDAGRIRQLVFADLREMQAAVAAAAPAMSDLQDVADETEQRLRQLDARTPAFADDHVSPDDVAALTAPRGPEGDTVHQLVMDLHHQVNRLQARLPLRDVAGASTWGLTPDDDALVGAFARGLQRTAGLKFDHPGLETTAARTGSRLSIQNDLGTTDAHVVVLHVEPPSISIVYSDIHARRVEFFQRMLQKHGVTWEESTAANGGATLVVGRVTAADAGDREAFLAFFASRLVFVIDWNRARKQLARFVRNVDAIAVLDWAAEHDLGHRAFLQCGGAQVIYTALERVERHHHVAGGRLDEQIGRRSAIAFLRAVLQACTDGLLAGRSIRVVQDEIEAELLAHLQDGAHSRMSLVADHAAYVTSLAERLRGVLTRYQAAGSRDDLVQAARLASRWESAADDIVRRHRQRQEPGHATDLVRELLEHGDDAADALEEAAFQLTLTPEHASPDALAALVTLADHVLNGARDYVRSIEYARHLPPGRPGRDLDECLVIIDRLVDFERQVDEAERQAQKTMLAACADFRELHVLAAVAHAFEEAADSMTHAALVVRDHLLGGDTDAG